ncbi:MAG TPA: hypothetical protein VFS40_15990 [Gemmatimonadales bacterium]|nr:hypothetical protein [Gemmatimonadales bacterium]
MKYILGLDLGQASDWTAMAVLQRIVTVRDAERPIKVNGVTCMERYREALPAEFPCRHLERAPLGTSYPTIVARVRGLMFDPAIRGQTALVVDATGVGRPVVDMLREAGLKPIPVTITGGDAVSRDGAGWRVPKRDLVGAVQVLLQSQRLKFAAEMPLVSTLVAELKAFRVKVSEQGHDSYGAWREGSHDDLVLALAVAAWYGERWTAPAEAPPSMSFDSLLPGRAYPVRR